MKKYKLIMVLASLLPLGLFFLPIWKITLKAPQYPSPLGMHIYIDKFEDANPYDIKNINLMNHYVGMKNIPETIPEFDIFPISIAVASLIGFFIAFRGNYKWFLAWFILMILLGAIGVYDFYLWEYDYGHNLSPKAIMKFTNPDGSIMGFQPPLFGTKQILNFTVHSYPGLGAYFLFGSLLTSFIAYFVEKKRVKTLFDKK